MGDSHTHSATSEKSIQIIRLVNHLHTPTTLFLGASINLTWPLCHISGEVTKWRVANS